MKQYLGWNATLGPKTVAEHISPMYWGYNAREHSSEYLAVEFSQSNLGDSISDDQIDAFVAWYKSRALATWPNLPKYFPMHSELPAGIRDGKTDVAIDPEEKRRFRERILLRL